MAEIGHRINKLILQKWISCYILNMKLFPKRQWQLHAIKPIFFFLQQFVTLSNSCLAPLRIYEGYVFFSDVHKLSKSSAHQRGQALLMPKQRRHMKRKRSYQGLIKNQLIFINLICHWFPLKLIWFHLHHLQAVQNIMCHLSFHHFNSYILSSSCCSLRKRAYSKEAVYSDKLQHYSTGRGESTLLITVTIPRGWFTVLGCSL